MAAPARTISQNNMKPIHNPTSTIQRISPRSALPIMVGVGFWFGAFLPSCHSAVPNVSQGEGRPRTGETRDSGRPQRPLMSSEKREMAPRLDSRPKSGRLQKQDAGSVESRVSEKADHPTTEATAESRLTGGQQKTASHTTIVEGVTSQAQKSAITNSLLVDRQFGYTMAFQAFPRSVSAPRQVVCRAFSQVVVQEGIHSTIVMVYQSSWESAQRDLENDARSQGLEIVRSGDFSNPEVKHRGKIFLCRDAAAPSAEEALVVALLRGPSSVLRLDIGVAGDVSNSKATIIDLLNRVSFFFGAEAAKDEMQQLIRSGRSGLVDNTYYFSVSFAAWEMPTEGTQPRPWTLLGPQIKSRGNAVISLTAIAGLDDKSLLSPDGFVKELEGMGHTLLGSAQTLPVENAQAVTCRSRIVNQGQEFENVEGLFWTPRYVLNVGIAAPSADSETYARWFSEAIQGIRILN